MACWQAMQCAPQLLSITRLVMAPNFMHVSVKQDALCSGDQIVGSGCRSTFPARSFISDFSGIDTKTPGVPALQLAEGLQVCRRCNLLKDASLHCLSIHRAYLWPHQVCALRAGGQLAGFFINNDEALATLPGEGQPAGGQLLIQPQLGRHSCLCAHLRPSIRRLGALHRLEGVDSACDISVQGRGPSSLWNRQIRVLTPAMLLNSMQPPLPCLHHALDYCRCWSGTEPCDPAAMRSQPAPCPPQARCPQRPLDFLVCPWDVVMGSRIP